MKQVKVGNKLYVLDTEAYEITEDTDAGIIFVPADSYNGYVEMNSYLSYITPYNYNAIKCNEPEFVAFTDIIMTDESNPAAMTVMYNKGLAKSSYYMTRGEAELVTNEQLNGLFNGNTSISYFNEFSYFTGITKIGTIDDTNASKTYAPFKGCTSLKEITLPKSVNELGARAFDSCSYIDKINGLEKVTKFGHCSLQSSFAVDSSMNINTLYIDKLNGAGSFNNLTHSEYVIKNIVIKDGVTTISTSAFNSNYHIENITIPNTVTSIGNNAFAECKEIRRINSDKDGIINIPNSITSIGNSAFVVGNKIYNEYIIEINIPDSVTTIGEWSFANYSYCETLNIGSGITSIGRDAFNYVGNDVDKFTMTCKAVNPPTWDGYLNSVEDISIYVPAESVDNYKAADGWKKYTSYISAIE